MNRAKKVLEEIENGVPHACGDEPDGAKPPSQRRLAFPTHVGMNRF